MTKYKAKKVMVNGETFDSKKEASRWVELKLLEKSGKISNLERQVKFVLIPAQYGPDERNGKKKLRCLEREAAYHADFVYTQDGKTVVEDAKSRPTKTKDYVLRRKLMLWRHGVRIKEV